jgi:hypothetical protein
MTSDDDDRDEEIDEILSAYNGETEDEEPAAEQQDEYLQEGDLTNILDARVDIEDGLISDEEHPEPGDMVLGEDLNRPRTRGPNPSFLESDVEMQHREMDESAVGPDGRLLGGIEQHVQYREIVQERERRISPPVNVVPESAYRGMLGRKYLILPKNVVAGIPQPETQERVEEAVRWSGRPTETLPVSVAWQPLSDPANVDAFVRISFGTRDGTQVVDIDMGHGGQLTLPASTVYVSVGIRAGSTIPLAGFALSASIGFFTVTRTSMLTRTEIFSLAPLSFASALRPKFATSIWIQRGDYISQINYSLRAANNAIITGGVILASTVLASNDLTNWIPLPNQCASVLFAVSGGSPGPANYAIIWGLNL